MPLGTPQFYLPHTIKDRQIQKNFDELIAKVGAADEDLDARLDIIEANDWVTNARMADESVGWVETRKDASGLAAGSFVAYPPVNSPVSSPAIGKVAMTSGYFDTSGWYSGVNARFTPQVKGVYRFSAHLLLNANGAAGQLMDVYLVKNGVPAEAMFGRGFHTGVTTLGVGGSVITTANGSTDYFEAWAQHSAAGKTLNTWPYSYWCGELVGRLS